MTCPRCGNEWDVSRSPCSQCGLLVRLPGRLGARAAASSQKTSLQHGQLSGNIPVVKPQSNGSTPLAPNKVTPNVSAMPDMPNSSNGVPPTPRPLSDPFNTANTVRRPYQSRPLPPSQELKPGEKASSLPLPSVPMTPRSFMPNGTDHAMMENRTRQKPAGVPPRPQNGTPNARIADTIAPTPRPVTSIRPSRLVTDPVTKENRQSAAQSSAQPFAQRVANPFAGVSSDEEISLQHQLSPGIVLRNGRYRLQEQQERQEWSKGAYEAWWVAQDAQRPGMSVMMCEVVTPDSASMSMQSMLRAATMALTSIGRHTRIPTLWDVFSDQGRSFFVFEPVEGESLLARMRRTGRALPEQDVVDCCLQMTEIIELLNQQSPPLVHGLIRPEHIIEGQRDSYMLTHFSVLLAGGITQLVVGADRSHFSPYTAPEFLRGMVDVRSDLYALLASAYHTVTGSVPAPVNGSSIPHAQQLNPLVSVQFDAILMKGLHPNITQRYQHPDELRQALLAMRSVNSTAVPLSGGRPRGAVVPASAGRQRFDRAERREQLMQAYMPQPPAPASPSMSASATANDSVAQLLPNMLAPSLNDFGDERKILLPRPEELPPLVQRNDVQFASFWILGILLCLVILVMIGRGLG
jgi:hypothetical protein